MTSDPSRRSRRQVLAYHRGDLPPAVDAAQPDLAGGHEAEEQDGGGVFTRERALRLYPAAEFLVEPLDDVCGAQRLPLRFREPEEGEQFVAALAQARHDARAPLTPRPLEGRVRDARGVGARSVDDAVEVVPDLGQRMLRRFPLKVAKLVDTPPLDRRPCPSLPTPAPHPGLPSDTP